MLGLQRTAGNQYVCRLLSREPAATVAPAVDTSEAFKAIIAWQAKAGSVLDASAAWESANWIDFLGKTGSNPTLTLADSDLAAVMSNAIGNVITQRRQGHDRGGGEADRGGMGAMIGTAPIPASEP